MIRRLIIAVALILGVAMVAPAASASAVHHHPKPKHHHHHVKHHHKKKPKVKKVPTCPSLADHTGTQVWTTANGTLASGIDELICSAAWGSTIDIKTWFFNDRGPVMDSVVHDLRTMARWHHVRVNILTGNPSPLWLHPIYSYGVARKYAHLYQCFDGCWSQVLGIAHAKWITVSKTVFGGPAMMSTSTNFSTYEIDTQPDSALYFYNDLPMQSAFVTRWNSYVDCAANDCPKAGGMVLVNGIYYPASGPTWIGRSRGASVFFSPILSNPILTELQNVKCSPTTVVRVLNPAIVIPEVIQQLVTLRQQGCTVHVVVNPDSAFKTAQIALNSNAVLHATCASIHDKIILISNRDETIAGAVDLNPHGIMRNDNQTIRIYGAGIYNEYLRYYAGIRHDATKCPASGSAPPV